MAKRPDLRRDVTPIGKGIVGRDGAIVVQPYDLAEVRVHILRRIELLALARADPEVSIRIESHTVSEVPSSGYFRNLAPDDLELGELVSIVFEHKPGTSYGGTARTAATVFRIAHI